MQKFLLFICVIEKKAVILRPNDSHVMKKIILILTVLLSCMTAFAQETYLFAQKDNCDLYLDIYRPAEDTQKPTILYVFGGGFIMGSRNDAYMLPWFKTLMENGYTVVAIDYRLGMKGYKVGKGLLGAAKSVKQFVKSQQMGVEDVFSAVTYLAQHPELGIDVHNIVLTGSSAGAIISLACVYAVANGDTEGLPEGMRFKGVMSFAGALISNTGTPSFKTAPCPMLLLHGTADKAVSYDYYGAFGMGMWGSSFIASQLKKKGWNCSIWRFKDRGHAVAAYMNYVWPIEKEFLEKNVMQGVPSTVDALIDDPSLPAMEEWSNISMEGIYNGELKIE